jgi:hypothetical protein
LKNLKISFLAKFLAKALKPVMDKYSMDKYSKYSIDKYSMDKYSQHTCGMTLILQMSMGIGNYLWDN